MPTLVTYTDTTPPRNQFPRRIISPTHSGWCWISAMEALGQVRREGRYEYTNRRCRTCGFTVRVFVRYLPDQERIAKLRKKFATAISRKFLPA